VNGKKLLDQELERYREKAMRYKEKFLETSYLEEPFKMGEVSIASEINKEGKLSSYVLGKIIPAGFDTFQ
jgi:hypothetical protein